MTDEILMKGNELTKRIGEVKQIIEQLTYRKVKAVSPEDYLAMSGMKNKKWMFRLFNQDKTSNLGNRNTPMMIVFNNVSKYGSDILLGEEDSELLDIIIEYYNNKQKKLEEELASL